MSGMDDEIPVIVSIEPTMDCDVGTLTKWMWDIQPDFISVGDDSGHNNLPEPPPTKIKQLVSELERFTEIKKKKKLNRLLAINYPLNRMHVY